MRHKRITLLLSTLLTFSLLVGGCGSSSSLDNEELIKETVRRDVQAYMTTITSDDEIKQLVKSASEESSKDALDVISTDIAAYVTAQFGNGEISDEDIAALESQVLSKLSATYSSTELTESQIEEIANMCTTTVLQSLDGKLGGGR